MPGVVRVCEMSENAVDSHLWFFDDSKLCCWASVAMLSSAGRLLLLFVSMESPPPLSPAKAHEREAGGCSVFMCARTSTVVG